MVSEGQWVKILVLVNRFVEYLVPENRTASALIGGAIGE